MKIHITVEDGDRNVIKEITSDSEFEAKRRARECTKARPIYITQGGNRLAVLENGKRYWANIREF